MLALLRGTCVRNDFRPCLATATRWIFGGKVQQGLAVDALRLLVLPVAFEAAGGEEQPSAFLVEVAFRVLDELRYLDVQRRLRVEALEEPTSHGERLPRIVEVSRGDV